ncbi:NACHT domain-containing protein [Streptomyces sp. NPDC059171]|uniref:NACHT domain-containing protein n=1 Tax=Streptomyces sp. NPDC059171 TaxID=3346755 RepID=UPI00367AFEB3
MKFDLYRLGPREFENLTQAIAVAELGPDVAVLGMGSDGGREATQNSADDEDYMVLQAKYKETSAPSQAEATWLIKEMRKEFKDWRESDKRERKPKRFIVATNVTLSATPKSGGFDRVVKVMKEECANLGIEEWIIWHSENINRFLEKHPGIRTSYAAWILPGDILSVIYDDVVKRNSEAARAVRSYVPKELLNDRYANLDQAGSADDRTVPLADVFFDVPVALNPDRNAWGGSRCLETLISACDVRHSANEHAEMIADNGHPPQNRFVLVGGPGQGKSTVSQFLCQLYRAQLVKDTSSMRNAEVRSAVTQINTQAAKDGLLPKARRWPMNVPLTRFADELAQGKCANLLDYIAQRVAEASSALTTVSDIRDWLQKFPWLLVLDGLDEVPGSSNRGQVLSAISAFQLEADELNADLVVVATTRPQGYTDEFSPKNYVHYYLTELDTQSALGYGRKLADARHGNSANRVNQLMARLERAASEPSTAHLMGTPLQVTIMAVLLDRVGKAPKDRFTLFADYYRVIFERELEKEGAASNLLRDHKADIDSIHADVGLLLQTRSERSGETESRLTIEEMDEIIKYRLASEGHAGAELTDLTAAISRAATHRLVFLVPTRDTEVSFEIRSLQEFWAADALMNCSEEQIAHRLRKMAISSHWRNVLLFALGNIFATRRNNLRDSVVALVSELNSNSEKFGNMPRRILTGSRLAVEILNDGMVRAPRYEAILVEESLKLLSLPYSEHVSLLAACVSDRGMSIIRDHFSASLNSANPPSHSILAFLATRTAHNDIWAYERLLALHCEASTEGKRDMFNIALSYELPSLLHVALRSIADPELTLSLAAQCGILQASNFKVLLAPKGCSSVPNWTSTIIRLFSRDSRDLHRRGALRVGPFRAILPSMSKCKDLLAQALLEGFPQEHWLARLAQFCEEPNKNSLAQLAQAIGPYSGGYRDVADHLPWIVYYAVELYEKFGDASVSMVRSGYLKDALEWEQIEQRWNLDAGANATTDDISEWCSEGTEFLPLPACSLTLSKRPGPVSVSVVDELVTILSYVKDGWQRQRVVDHFFRVSDPFDNDVTPEIVERLYGMAEHQKPQFFSFSWLRESDLNDDWSNLLDRMGRDITVGHAWVPFQFPERFAKEWSEDLTRFGLGRLAVSRGFSELADSAATRAFHFAWDRVRGSGELGEVERTVCLVVSVFTPPRDIEEAIQRLSCLRDSVQADDVSASYLAELLALDCTEPSRSLVLALADLPELTPYDRHALHARMVRLQASEPTEIEYTEMRPC